MTDATSSNVTEEDPKGDFLQNHRTFIWCVAGIFALCFSAGAFSAWSTPYPVTPTLQQMLASAYLEKAGGHLSLSIRCSGPTSQPVYWQHINSKRYWFGSPPENQMPVAAVRVASNPVVQTAVLGGGAAEVFRGQVKALRVAALPPNAPWGKKAGRIAAIAIAGVSGYSLGEWLLQSPEPRCGSDEALVWLRSQQVSRDVLLGLVYDQELALLQQYDSTDGKGPRCGKGSPISTNIEDVCGMLASITMPEPRSDAVAPSLEDFEQLTELCEQAKGVCLRLP